MDQRLVAADAALKAGRRREAIDLMVSVLNEAPDQPLQVYRVLVMQFYQAGLIEEGEPWAAKATQRFPKDSQLWNVRGVMLRRLARYDEALAALDQAIKLNPKDASAQSNKGNVYNDRGDGAKAEAVFSRLVRQDPRNAEFQRALGRALRDQGKSDQAVARFRQAATLKKDYVDAWLDWSGLEGDRGRIEAALEVIDKGIAALPEVGRLHEARAVLLERNGQLRAAEDYLKSLEPLFGQTGWWRYRLGVIIADYDRPRANACLRHAVELEPRNPDYLVGLAESLSRTRGPEEAANIDEACGILRRALSYGPLNIKHSKVLADVFGRVCAFDEVEAIGGFKELGRYWAETGRHTALFHHLARVRTFEDRLELVRQHRIWGELIETKAAAQPLRRTAPPTPRSKVRLGFMSSDLRNHPVAYFALPLFEHADRERFELFCYSFYQGKEDDTQARITSLSDGFRWRPEISDRDAAQLIADDQIDMLIELGGSTHMNKLAVMACKPAPLSASWLGYPHSTGLKTIDYLILDPFMIPEKPGLMIEKPLVLPHTWYPLSPEAFRNEPAVAPTSAFERNDFVTFGSANNPMKYGAEMLRVWARVVAATPNARFMFVRPEAGCREFRRNVEAVFDAEGVDASRLVFVPVRGNHLVHYNNIDISLDTFPQTGGTTTCESLWMGVPVVTLVGPGVFERLSYSTLMNAGLGELCARTEDAFIEVAVTLAQDRSRLSDLKRGLRERMRACPMGQTAAFAKDFYDLIAETVGQSQAANIAHANTGLAS